MLQGLQLWGGASLRTTRVTSHCDKITAVADHPPKSEPTFKHIKLWFLKLPICWAPYASLSCAYSHWFLRGPAWAATSWWVFLVLTLRSKLAPGSCRFCRRLRAGSRFEVFLKTCNVLHLCPNIDQGALTGELLMTPALLAERWTVSKGTALATNRTFPSCTSARPLRLPRERALLSSRERKLGKLCVCVWAVEVFS